VGNVKAASIIDTLDVARELLGAATYGEVLDALPPVTRALVERRLLPVEWVPVDDWMPFIQALLDRAFRGDEEQLRRLARKVCERDFNTFYKVILKILVSPDFLLERAAKLWRTYHDSGELKVISREKRGGRMHIQLRVEKLHTQYAVFGALMQGFIEQLFHMTGARDVRVERQVKVGPAGLDGDFAASYLA
jgi:hypothetical protein